MFALDLDYLEKREYVRKGSSNINQAQAASNQSTKGNNSKTSNSHSDNPPGYHDDDDSSNMECSPDSLDLVKVILLGAPAVGKTSIVQQFVWNNYTEEYFPTDRKHTYYPSVIINDHLYEIKISDLPVIPYFPVNSYYEWTDFRFYGLRSASAYILVFDLSNIDTFQYVRTLKEQIFESRDMKNVPLLVVGNKHDTVCADSATTTSETSNVATDIANLVKKHWKCGYIECSAKFNWRIMAVFKELMTMLVAVENKSDCSPMYDNIQEAFDRNNKCLIT